MLGSLMCIYMHSYLPQIHGHVVLYVAITCACINLCRKRASLGICVRETRIPRDMCAGKHASLGNTYHWNTVLGPLLFLVYINDITDYVSSSCWLFADDCILYRQINSPTDAAILHNDLKELEYWEKVWKMKFNIEKYMILANSYLEKLPLLPEYYLHIKS